MKEPLVNALPAAQPKITLLSPELRACPAFFPSTTLKQVSESDAAPALVPAYKLSCASGSNPTSVRLAPDPRNDTAVNAPVLGL